MNFKSIQDAVIADLLDETDRATVKEVVNSRGRMLWGLEEWTFRRGSSNVSVTAGSNVVGSLPADFGILVDLFRDDGVPLRMFGEYRDFAELYLGSDNTWTGKPEACTVIGGQVFVGPVSADTSSTYLLVYEKAWTELAGDGDVPGLPADTHLALVFGGKADMCILKNILLNEPLEQRAQEYLQTMQRDYLVTVRGEQHQTPAYRPGGGYSGRWLVP